MGKSKSHRSSLKMAAVIRKKAKAKRARLRKEAKTKQYPKRSKKMLKAPASMPFREMIEAQVHESSAFLNQVIRPIQSTRVEDKTKPYDNQLKQIKNEIQEKYAEKVKAANETFQALTEAIEQADAIIQVLDARDPFASRLCEAENEVIRGKNKPMINVINKIDMVPREAVLGWITELKQIAPTVALSAVNREASFDVLKDVIGSTCPNAQKIGVIGFPGVGKTTICQYNPQLLIEVPSYQFIESTTEMGLLQGQEYIGSMKDLAIRTMSRKTDDDLFLAFEIPAQDTPEDVINVLAKKWQIKPHLACKKFISAFWNREVLFFTIPQTADADGLPDSQVKALQAAVPVEMSGKVYIHLQRGNPLTLNNKLLGVQDEEEDSEEEDEVENE